MASDKRSSLRHANNTDLGTESMQTDHALPDKGASTALSASTSSPAKGKSDISASRVFCCNQCPRTFTRRENLSRHEKTHSAPWAHRCAICGRGFARSDLLSRHEAGHQRWAEQDVGRQRSNISNKRRTHNLHEDDIVSIPPQSPDHSNVGQPEVRSSPQDSQHFTPESNSNRSDLSPHTAKSFSQPNIQVHTPHGFVHVGQSFAAPVVHHELAQQDVLSPSQPSFQARRDSEYILNENPNLMTFDLSGFLLPNDGSNDINENSYAWFSNEFYSAMQETGNETFGLGEFDSSIFSSFDHRNQNLGHQITDQGHVLRPQNSSVQEGNGSDEDRNAFGGTRNNEAGRVSRMASPPNEASEEDKWAFAWDPKSRPILYADPIHFPPEHPLWKQHSSRFDISEQTYQKVQAFVASRMEGMSTCSILTLPTLQEANIMIGLYFTQFSHQIPVLHHATVNTNRDLPPSLLGVMLVIGAIYSQLRGTRRFAIVLLDIVRWHLQVAIECDNSLMRDPKIIFAETLICYAGLWCGNKRAFELAEVVRATVVKQVRSAHFWREDGKLPEIEKPGSLKSRWLQWVQKESHRRLFWVVYSLDALFTSLLYLPAMFALGEVREMCCPCDEEFWAASSARNWKFLLGPALIPPARVFSAAAAPFLWSHWENSVTSTIRQASHAFSASTPPALGLNAWSAFLVLVTMQNQIFQFSQERLFWNSCCGEEDEAERAEGSQRQDSEHTSEDHQDLFGPKYNQRVRRRQFKVALSSFQDAYLSNSSKHESHLTFIHFRQSAFVGHVLTLILLDVPFTDIQGAFGKNGKEGIATATLNIRRWMNEDSQIAEDVIHTSLKTIKYLATNRVGTAASEQSIIAMFLSYVLVWIFTNIACREGKQAVINRLARNEEIWNCSEMAFIKREMERETNISETSDERISDAIGTELSWGILKSGAQCLTQLGTWGAALNLALLLQRRSEM